MPENSPCKRCITRFVKARSSATSPGEEMKMRMDFNAFVMAIISMKMASTYTDSGWNFIDTWIIDSQYNEGYPILKWQVDGVGVVNETLPQSFILHQNYPNPFNPRTTIGFQLSADSKTELSIFDMNGKKVATLIRDNMSAGYYEISWDASSLSSGIYFYSLQVDDFVDTKKMVFMK